MIASYQMQIFDLIYYLMETLVSTPGHELVKPRRRAIPCVKTEI